MSKASRILKKFVGLGIGFVSLGALITLASCTNTTQPTTPPTVDPPTTIVDPVTPPEVDPPTTIVDPVTPPEVDPVDEKEKTRQEKEGIVSNYIVDLANNFTLTTSTYVAKYVNGVIERNGVIYEKNSENTYDVFTPYDETSYTKETISEEQFLATVGTLNTFSGIKISGYNYDSQTVFIKLENGWSAAAEISNGDLVLTDENGAVGIVGDKNTTEISEHTNIHEAEIDDPTITPVETYYAIKDGKVNATVVKEVLTDWISSNTNNVQSKVPGFEDIKLINVADGKLEVYYTSKVDDKNYFRSFMIDVDEINSIFTNKTNTPKEELITKLSSVPRSKVKTNLSFEYDNSVSQSESKARVKALTGYDADFAFETAGADSVGYWGWTTYAYADGKLYSFKTRTNYLANSKVGVNASNCSVNLTDTITLTIDNTELFAENTIERTL